MTRRLPSAWWLVSLVPASLRVLVDLVDGRVRPEVWALTAAPGLALLAVVALAWARRALELRRELSVIAQGLLVTLALCGLQALALDAGQVAGLPARPLLGELRFVANVLGVPLVCFGLFLAASASWGREFSSGTLTAWVMTPRPRWLLAARKLGVLAFGIGVVVAQALIARSLTWADVDVGDALDRALAGRTFVLALAALAFAVAPALTLVSRGAWGALLAAVLSFSAVSLLLVFAGEWAVWGGVAGLVPLGLGATFLLVARLDPTAPAPDLASAPPGTRWTRAAAALVRSALWRKELMLQRGPLAIGAASAGLWGALAIARGLGLRLEGFEDVGWAPLAPLSVLCALSAGALTLSQERQLSTSDWMETTLGRARLFRVKVLASLGVTVVAALLVPGVLVAVSPGWGAVAQEGASVVERLGWWVAAVATGWGLGLFLFSAPWPRRSPAASIGHALGIAAFVVAMALTVGLVDASGPRAGCLGAGSVRALAVSAAALGPLSLLPVVACALWGAHALWRHQRPLSSVAVGAVVTLVAVGAMSFARVHARRAAAAPLCTTSSQAPRPNGPASMLSAR